NRFPRLAAKTNFYAGNVYSDIGDVNNTALYFLKALAYFEKTGDDKTVAGLLNNLGNLHLGQNNNEKAIEYFEKSLSKIAPESRNYSSIIFNLGIAYKNTGQYEKALENYGEALKIETARLDSFNMAKTYNGIGIVYKNMEEYDKALENYYLALEIKERLGNPKYISSTLNSIASVKKINKDFNTTIDLSLRSYDLANSVNAKNEVYYALENLYDAYEHLGEYEEALKYFKVYHNIKDSLFYQNEESKRLTHKYEIDAREKEIELQKAQSKSKNYFIILLGLIILITVIVVLFYLKNQKATVRQKISDERAKEAENQKKRFARELHDGTGSNLTGIRLQLLALDSQADNNIRDIVHEVERTHQGIRLLAYQASPPEFDHYTLDEALTDLVGRLTKTGSIQIQYSSTVTFNWSQVSKDLQLTVYRIIQEALSNVIKHSEAKLVDIQLIQHRDSINILVEDNGKGFKAEVGRKGLGHKNMSERAKRLNGTFQIDSTPGTGTTIIIDLPLPKNLSYVQ
nr:tetratricopeptide repeat protein [Bacteroidota bacterium]